MDTNGTRETHETGTGLETGAETTLITERGIELAAEPEFVADVMETVMEDLSPANLAALYGRADLREVEMVEVNDDGWRYVLTITRPDLAADGEEE